MRQTCLDHVYTIEIDMNRFKEIQIDSATEGYMHEEISRDLYLDRFQEMYSIHRGIHS